MASIERTAYPRFARSPSATELARLYTPTLRELDLSRQATRGGRAQQLAFLVMLESFRRLGYFPKPDRISLNAATAMLRRVREQVCAKGFSSFANRPDSPGGLLA